MVDEPQRARRRPLFRGPVIVRREDGDGHDEWNQSVRGELPEQRADRNFIELLQELRVLQTGVQILFALLLTVAFTNTFSDADTFQHTVYVVTLMCCALATALLISPVAYHRALFQRGRKPDLVAAAHRLLQAGLVVLAAAVVGSLLLVMDQAVGRVMSLIIAPVIGVVFLMLWFVLPGWTRRGGPAPPAGGVDAPQGATR